MKAELFIDWVEEGTNIYIKMLENEEDAMSKATAQYLRTALETIDEKKGFKLSCKVLSELLSGVSEL